MDACHSLEEEDSKVGGASSTSSVEPHFEITQFGASRSVSPLTDRSERRFWEVRKRAEDNWYLSGKIEEGRVI